MGAGVQGIRWDDGFCQLLVSGGRYVTRYDQRDTGKSSCFDFDDNPYRVGDLATDAIGFMDAYEVDSSHVVGASLGGMVAQTIAIEYPSRIRTLTSIISTPGVAETSATNRGEVTSAPSPDPPSTRDDWIERRVQVTRRLTGSLAPFDEARVRRLVTREAERARTPRLYS